MSTTQQEQTRAAAPQEYLLEMRGITKAFAGVQALKGVDFYVRPGTVHARRCAHQDDARRRNECG